MTYVIAADGLGKQYRLHRSGRRPDTLREAITQAGRNALQRLRRGGRGQDSSEFWAVRNASFAVSAGEVVGVIGRNGAGKSTLLKLLSRVTDPTEGRIHMRGRVASLLEVGTGFHQELSGRENIFLNGAILGMRRKETAARLDQIVEFSGIEPFIDEPVKHLSSGMYMRLAFAVGAFLDCKILLVDEVLAVGDAAFQQKCLGTMRDAAKGGRTVIFVSHNMSAISHLTQRSIVLRQGEIAFDGPTPAAVGVYAKERQAQDFVGRRPTAEIEFQNHYRDNDGLIILEMGLASGQSREICPAGTIRMEFLIEAKSAYEGVRLAYTFNGLAGPAQLTGLSPTFPVRPGRQLVELLISDINLVPGDYEMSIYLGTGGLLQSRKEYDMYLGFGRLTVSSLMSDNKMFSDWDRMWARAYHTSSQLLRIERNA